MKEQPRILIVDDEEFNLDIMKDFLEGEGYLIVSAENGEEVVNMLAHDKAFDAIVLDRMMPLLDGMSVLKHIKADPNLRHIPVIMQSAAATEEQIAQGLRAGAYKYLTKPFAQEELLAVVQAALRANNTSI